jgi:hypothetical protein
MSAVVAGRVTDVLTTLPSERNGDDRHASPPPVKKTHLILSIFKKNVAYSQRCKIYFS